MGTVAIGLGHGKPYRIFFGQKGAADQAVAVGDSPMTVTVGLDVEVAGHTDVSWDEIAHLR